MIRTDCLRSITLAVVCLAVAGCVRFTGIDHVETKHEIPPAVVDSGFTAWPTTEWWKGYHDSVLNDLVAHALADNPNIHIAEARLRAAQAAAGYVGANRSPRVELNASSAAQRFSEQGFSPPNLAGDWETDNRIAFDASYELDFFGKNRTAFESMEAQVGAAAASAQAARLQIATAVARTYFKLGRFCAEREVTRATREQRANILALVKARVAEGIDSNVELRQAEGGIPRIESELTALDERISLLRIALATLAQVQPNMTASITPVLGQTPTPKLPVIIPSDFVARRPEIETARLRVEAGLKGIESVKAEFYPRINLAAFAGFGALGLDALFQGGSQIFGITPMVRLPIFDADHLRSKLKFVNAETDVTIAEYNRALIQSMSDVVHTVTSIRALAARQVAQRAAQQAAESAYELALQRFKVGLTGYLTVLATESEVLVERRTAATLHARAFELDVDLIRSLGGGYDAEASLARN